MGSVLPTREEDPSLTVVISKLTQPYSDNFERVKAEIIESTETNPHRQGEQPFPMRFTANLHDDGLIALPLGWEEASVRIADSPSLETGDILLDLTFQQWSDEIAPLQLAAQELVSTSDERRKALATYASELIHGEGSGPGPFLDASFIKKLIGGHRRELPRVVAIGAKGAGKTFTFLRMVGHGTWQAFAKAAQSTTDVDATIIPVVWPVNLRDRAKGIIDGSYEGQGQSDKRSSLLRELRDEAKRTLTTATEWRDWWLDRLAMAVGATSRNDLAGTSGSPPLFVIDGLEDLLQDVKHDVAEQKCLRALLQEVPAWLKAASSPCGLVVFVRADYVGAAIPQNTEQFRAAYQAYDLRWDRQEALRLVQWIAEQAGVLSARPSSHPGCSRDGGAEEDPRDR